jgi:hypothetical protein
LEKAPRQNRREDGPAKKGDLFERTAEVVLEKSTKGRRRSLAKLPFWRFG